MTSGDFNYMGDSQFGSEEHYFNPDVYAAVNQIMEETDSIDKHINNQIRKKLDGLTKKVESWCMSASGETVPCNEINETNDVIKNDGEFCETICGPDKIPNAGCCTCYCDQLSKWFDPIKCKKYCGGDGPPDGLCCLKIRSNIPISCERIQIIVNQCGGYDIVCEGQRGTPTQSFMILNIPCKKIEEFKQCMNTLITGLVFEFLSVYPAPCDKPPPDCKDIPPEMLKRCCPDKPPPPPPDPFCCPSPPIIINNTCPPPKIENVIKLNLDDLQVVCKPIINVTCPPPVIKNIIECPENPPPPECCEEESKCDDVYLDEESELICSLRREPNHLKWMVSKEGRKALIKFASDVGWPTSPFGDIPTVNFAILFGQLLDQRSISSPVIHIPSY